MKNTQKKRFWYCLKIFQSSETLLGALRAQIVVKTCFFLQKKLKLVFALDVALHLFETVRFKSWILTT